MTRRAGRATSSIWVSPKNRGNRGHKPEIVRLAVTELGYKTYSADLSPSAWLIWCLAVFACRNPSKNIRSTNGSGAGAPIRSDDSRIRRACPDRSRAKALVDLHQVGARIGLPRQSHSGRISSSDCDCVFGQLRDDRNATFIRPGCRCNG